MGLFEGLITIIGTVLTLAVGYFKVSSDHYRNEADTQRNRADRNAAAASAMDHARRTLEQTAELQLAARKPADTKNRTDLEEHW